MGLVVPGFIPTPLGEVFEYTPTAARAAGGGWASGPSARMVFTLLAKASIGIELGRVRQRGAAEPQPAAGTELRASSAPS